MTPGRATHRFRNTSMMKLRRLVVFSVAFSCIVGGNILGQEGWTTVPVSTDPGRFVPSEGWIKPPISDGTKVLLLKERSGEISIVDLAPAEGPLDSMGEVYSRELHFSVPLLFDGETFLVGVTAGADGEIAIARPGEETKSLVPAPGYFNGQAVATREKALIVWQEASSGDGVIHYSIRFLIIDRDLEVIAGPETLGTAVIAAGGPQPHPKAIATETGFAVVWRRSELASVNFTALDPSGRIIRDRAITLIQVDDAVAVASDRANLLLSWTAEGNLATLLLSHEGDPLTPTTHPFVTASATGTPAVAWTGTDYRIAWSEVTGPERCRNRPVTSEIRFGRLSPEGNAVGPISTLSAGDWNRFPYLVSANGRPIVVWETGSCDGDASHWVATSPPGEAVTPVSGFMIPRSQRKPVVASNGHHVVAVWEELTGSRGEPRVFASSAVPGGRLIFEGVLVADLDRGSQTSPVISFDGERFLVTWIEDDGSERTLRARFVHPFDGPVEDASRIASLKVVQRDAYANQLNRSYLASTFAGGAHWIFWLDGTSDEEPDTHLMSSRVTIGGVASRERIIGGPWRQPFGIDATATAHGVVITWSVRSANGNVIYRGTPQGGDSVHEVFKPVSSYAGVSDPGVVRLGDKVLVTWLSESGHDPYRSLTAMTDPGEHLVNLSEPCDCSLTYAMVSDELSVDLYWTLYGHIHFARMSHDLALERPVKLFEASEVSATRHSRGTVLVTRRGERVYVHFPETSTPRRRAVRR
jgi:hypothetical protein